MKLAKRILLLKAGEAGASVRLSVGDYDRWFTHALKRVRCRLQVVRVWQGQRLPKSLSSYDGVMITGSPLSVIRPTAWMKRAADFLRKAAERDVAVLGVCFGHQLLGYAYGANVVLNPKGREIGTISVSLTPRGVIDPLFRELPEKFSVQTTHQDVVERLPDGATILAENESTSIQAMAIGRLIRGVQFHPELTPEGVQAIVLSRAEALAAEAAEHGRPPKDAVPTLLSAIRPTPAGEQILANFLKYFC